MIHSIGVEQSNALKLINNYNNSNISACVHAFIDANTGEVYQTLPWNVRGWHCGGDANNTHIGIEMCEPDFIKYTGGCNFKVVDKEKATNQCKTAYNSAVILFADLCNKFNLNPIEKGVIISHNEGRLSGIASNHYDPEHLWKGLGVDYTMNTFREDVYEKMKEQERYDTIDKIPIVYKPTIEKLVNRGIIRGNNGNLDLSKDMCRILVFNDRSGLYGA